MGGDRREGRQESVSTSERASEDRPRRRPSIPDRVPTVESPILPGDGVSERTIRLICRSDDRGGVLVPLPEFLVLGLPPSQQGALLLPFAWPNNFPAGFPFYMQFWMNDPSGSHGLTATNGLQGVSP